MGVSRARPVPAEDGQVGNARLGRYGETYVDGAANRDQHYAGEGSYFVAVTPTPGTGVIGHAAPTTFDEAKPYMVLFNGGTNYIYPQFITLYETVAGVGHTRVQFTLTIDNGDRRSSAGSALTINNVNMTSTNASSATCYVGAVVATAATGARRLLGNYPFRGTIDIIEDSYTLIFGGHGGGSASNSRVATVADNTRVVPPVVVGPQESFLITQWAVSQSTGPTWEVVMGFVER